MQSISNYLDKSKSFAYAGKTEPKLCRMENSEELFCLNPLLHDSFLWHFIKGTLQKSPEKNYCPTTPDYGLLLHPTFLARGKWCLISTLLRPSYHSTSPRQAHLLPRGFLSGLHKSSLTHASCGTPGSSLQVFPGLANTGLF